MTVVCSVNEPGQTIHILVEAADTVGRRLVTAGIDDLLVEAGCGQVDGPSPINRARPVHFSGRWPRPGSGLFPGWMYARFGSDGVADTVWARWPMPLGADAHYDHPR